MKQNTVKMNKAEFTNHIAERYTKLLGIIKSTNKSVFIAVKKEAEMYGLTEQDAIDAVKAINPNAYVGK